ncbi:MAG: anti-sigma factor family protein [Gemmatimonadota bacterium]
MKQGIMREHLTREQIAALLDDPGAVAGGLAHLDECEACASEFEGMSRMRMALSGLPDLSPPEGEWDAIRSRLPHRTASTWLRTMWSTPVAAAAVILLFLGGLAVGRMIAPAGQNAANPGLDVASRTAEPGTNADPGAVDGDLPMVGTNDDRFDDYLQTVGRLRQLRDAGPVGPTLVENPALAAERLTRLDALIDATRESLRMAPADPALNDFLFDVVDERESLAGQLDQTLRQASMEY